MMFFQDLGGLKQKLGYTLGPVNKHEVTVHFVEVKIIQTRICHVCFRARRYNIELFEPPEASTMSRVDAFLNIGPS